MHAHATTVNISEKLSRHTEVDEELRHHHLRYPMLFGIARHNHLLVADVLSILPLNMQFRRALTGNKRNAWLQLVERLMDVSLSTQPDAFLWKLTTSGLFSVKCMYADFLNGHTIC